jgi:YfiH family protein
VPVVDRIEWPGGITGLISGRGIDVAERGTTYGTSNLALHVGDDPQAVDARRRRLLDVLGNGGARLVALRADHGHAVRVVTADEQVNPGPDHYDIAVTDLADIALLSMAADCVPVALADPVAGVIGVAHAGWRGTASGVMATAVEALSALGADPARLRVHLGPAACGRCYVVGPEVVEALAASLAPGADRPWQAVRGTEVVVDLRAALRLQATALGIPATAITITDRCTIEDPELFSHRRDGAAGPTGRHGLVLRRSAS